MRFFLDNCTSPYHAKGLRGFAEVQKYEIVHLRERFDSNTPDITWLTTLGAEHDWIVVSGDLRITRNPAERAAWYESKLTGFFFGDAWAELSFWKQAADLVKWWPELVLQARKTPAGHGFVIAKNSKAMRQIYPS